MNQSIFIYPIKKIEIYFVTNIYNENSCFYWQVKKMNTDEYSHELGRRVVQDLAHIEGFHGVRQNACDLFVDILEKCKIF